MLPKKMKSNQTRTVIIAFITLVVGVLFCCSLSFGNGLSWLLGICLCFVGALYILNSMFKKRTLLSSEAVIGIASLTFGVMFIIKTLAQFLIDYVLYLMIAIGIAIIVEAFLSKFARYNSVGEFIFTLLAGIVVTALAFCLMFIPGWSRVAAVVFGCILIGISLYTLITLLLSKDKK